MQNISINVHIPRNAAIAAGAIIYGDTAYEPTAEEIGQLSTLEATALLHYEGQDAQRLVLGGYSTELWPLIRVALHKAIEDAAIAQQKRADRAKARMHLFEWIASNKDLVSPSLYEATMHEYDTASRYVFEIARKLTGIDTMLAGMTEPIITCYEQLVKNTIIEERPDPSLYALTLQTRLATAIAIDFRAAPVESNGKELPPSIEPSTCVTLQRISRLTPKNGDKRQTVVIATVAHPATSYSAAVVWSAEDNRTLPGIVHELRDVEPGS